MGKKLQSEKQNLEQMIGRLRDRYRDKLRPLLEGLAYRFTIWLPILAQGKPVFSEDHQFLLNGLFHDCCGGLSQSSVQGFAPWSGSWVPEGAEKPLVDHHIQMVIYSLQDTEATFFFRQLKWVLQQEQVAAQQVVLIEQVPVNLIEAMELV